MTSITSLLVVERFERVARLTLNRPAKRNALNPDLLDEFSARLAELDRDAGVSVIVVRGNGPAFCSGYDISADGDPERAYRRANGDVLGDWRAMRSHTRRWLDLWHLSTPTIAQVHGYCLAGGAELALNCDLVFAAHDATIGHPVVRDLGVPTANVYPYLIGLRRAKELMLTGATVSGQEAAELGLINRSLPAAELEHYVLAFATRMAEIPKVLLALNKQVTNDAFSALGYEQGLSNGANFDALAHASDEVRRALAPTASVGRARARTLRAARNDDPA
jgi:enoyl-CoA hydratase